MEKDKSATQELKPEIEHEESRGSVNEPLARKLGPKLDLMGIKTPTEACLPGKNFLKAELVLVLEVLN